MSVSPFLMRPCFSASRIMRLPMRSFTDPPALKNSHFARTSHSMSAATLLMRTSGGHTSLVEDGVHDLRAAPAL